MSDTPAPSPLEALAGCYLERYSDAKWLRVTVKAGDLRSLARAAQALAGCVAALERAGKIICSACWVANAHSGEHIPLCVEVAVALAAARAALSGG